LSFAGVSADLLAQDLAYRHLSKGLKVPDFSSGKRFLYTLSMSGQAELFEIRFSGFNGRCTEGM
jgi:hypothetical protein